MAENGLSDEYIVCDECDKQYKKVCSVHGPLQWIKDSSSQPLGHSQARSSLPRVLSFKSSTVGDFGVFAADNINARVKFGPFVGKRISAEDVNPEADQDYMWDIFDNKWIHSYILDATDEKQSNWMRFVKFASKKEDQNLVAFQYCEELFYRTCREIKAGEELLVWYEDLYCCKMEELCDQTMTLEGARFFCKKCNIAFLGSTILSKHNKYHCVKEEVEKFDCWICQEEFTSNSNMLKHIDDHMKGVQVKEEYTETVVPHVQQPEVIATPSKLVQQARFECKKCSRSFTTKRGLSYHNWNHKQKDERMHHGKLCEQGTFKKSHSFQTLKRKKYSCEICGKPCGGQLALYRHSGSSYCIKRTSHHIARFSPQKGCDRKLI